jgi:hypothetical protein
MANYQFTFRNARGEDAGAITVSFADDDHALRHARALLTRYPVVEVARGATRVAHLTAPTDFGRRPRFTTRNRAPRKGLAGWFSRRAAR